MSLNRHSDLWHAWHVPEKLLRYRSNRRDEPMLQEELHAPSLVPTILLVDDDPVFGKVMQHTAAQNGASLTYCRDIEDFGSLQHLKFDVGIVDFDLGEVTGVELIWYLERYSTLEIPVVLVSQTTQQPSHRWPSSLREFVHKERGPVAVLEAAFEIYAHGVFYQAMES